MLVRELGRGGMGNVYLAREPALKRSVAVKVMLPDLARDATSRARFEREAQAVAAIAHPNVVAIHGVGALPGGTPYFVMQFVEGRSLEARLAADGPISVREARRLLGEVASALAAAHKRGIVHRDIKPANILQDEDTGRAIVTDFGIAAVRSTEAQSPRLTQTGMSPGTPSFMSPEQLLGEPITDKSDIYSFGVLAFELLTGSGPFRISSPHEAVAAALRDTPPPLRTVRPEADPDLEQLIAICLAKSPEQRPTAEQIAQRLLPSAATLLEWPPPGLESLSGRLPALARQLALGSLLFTIGLLGMLSADPDRGPTFLLPLWMLGVFVMIGGVVLLYAVGAAMKLSGRSRRLERRGYRWLTILEVLCDPRGDTGALISGSREYAALGPAVRSSLRGWRVAAGLCEVGAAAMPLLSLLILTRLGSRGALTPVGGIVLVLLPAILLLIAAAMLRAAESRLVRRQHDGRARSHPADPVARNVVDAWAASFENARRGQELGGRALPPALGRAIVTLVLLGMIIATAVAAPLSIITPVGEVLTAMAIPKFGSTLRRIRRAEVGRGYGLPPAPAFPAGAGDRAMHSLELAGTTPAPGMRPAAQDIVWSPDLSGNHNPFGMHLAFFQDSLLWRATRGSLTAAQRAFLERIASSPVGPVVDTAARSPALDLIGARYTPSSLDSMSWFQVGIMRFSVMREIAYSRTAVAALQIVQRRPADAEASLREEIGLGLNIMDHGTTMMETEIGSIIASNGLDRLETFYAATGRETEARRLRATRDSALSRSERENDAYDRLFDGKSPSVATRLGMRQMLADHSLPLSFRWEIVHSLPVSECVNAREVVFGTAPATLAALDSFRADALHSAADSAFYRMSMAGWSRIGTGERTVPGLIVGSLLRTASRVLGTPRFALCASQMGLKL